MEFEFAAPGLEEGFVEFVSNGFDAAVKVSTGRGSRTQTHQFGLRAQINLRPVDPADVESVVRRAIASTLKRVPLTSNVMYSPEDLDMSGPEWSGTITPYVRPA